jgi:hypothetical protein
MFYFKRVTHIKHKRHDFLCRENVSLKQHSWWFQLTFCLLSELSQFYCRQRRLNTWAVARGPTITGAHANLCMSSCVHHVFFFKLLTTQEYFDKINHILIALVLLTKSVYGSFSDNFYNSDGKDCNCVSLILQKNNKLKLQ